jgi:LacI family transcriptional regulator
LGIINLIMASIKEIAALAQVSTATVSHVFNRSAYVSPELEARVMKAARTLNYQPNQLARSLRTRQSRTIGMIIPNITNPFFPEVVRAVEDVLNREGYTLVLGNSDYDLQKEEAYYRTFMAKRVDGLILEITPVKPPQHLYRHNWEDVPVVYIDRLYQGLAGDVVLVDSLAGSHEAVCHLLDRGHRRIGIITGPLSMLMASKRLRGYRIALKRRGLALDQELIREGRFDFPSGYEHARSLLKLPSPPTALYACNGLMALGCLQAIREQKLRCPEEIALVSFDDLSIFEMMQPPITAVSQPVYEIGSTAAEMLMQRISGKVTGPPRRKILKTRLIVRESSNGRFSRGDSAP